MTRRVLLAAGGLVVLGELVAGEGSGATSQQPRSGGAPRTRAMRGEAGLPHASASPNASPNARPVANRQQAEPDHTVAGQPAKSAHANASGGQPSHEAVPRERRPPPANGQPVTTIDDGPKVVALTIDDGPSPTYTPQILRLLQSYGITATFSMIGRNVAAYPSLAREVSAAGHIIVNHTWSHANLPLLAPVAQADQMTRASAVIQQATGQKPAMFRAPYGAWSPDVLAAVPGTGAHAAGLVRRPARLVPPRRERHRGEHHAEHPHRLDHPGARRRREPVPDRCRAHVRAAPPARPGFPFRHPIASRPASAAVPLRDSPWTG